MILYSGTSSITTFVVCLCNIHGNQWNVFYKQYTVFFVKRPLSCLKYLDQINSFSLLKVISRIQNLSYECMSLFGLFFLICKWTWNSSFLGGKLVWFFADLGKWAPFQCQEKKNKFIKLWVSSNSIR